MDRGIAVEHVPGPELAAIGISAARLSARQRQQAARYLAGKVPVIETGRLLSLEQVPTEGLRY
ncbi:hypothetical protein FJD35_21780 [Pseudomonas mandelii]|nr:hypothetical protein FJD35_21780 [Pseudomonas mandelii]